VSRGNLPAQAGRNRTRVKIALITIGQSPRDDIVAEMRPLIGAGIDITERGALDGLSRDEIGKLKPGRRDFPLMTRLTSGDVVIVGKKKITPLIQRQITACEDEGVTLSALLCTEDFPEIESLFAPTHRRKRLLLLPSVILRNAVTAMLRGGSVIGVLVPLDSQKRDTVRKWEKTGPARPGGLEVVVETAHPYHAIPICPTSTGRQPGESEAARSLARIRDANADLIILDCFGYSLKMKEAVQKITRKPVLLPRSFVARYISEMC
jgi:protein AroM